MSFTPVVCPTCNEEMHMGPAKIGTRISMVLCCFTCPLISELTNEIPVQLADFAHTELKDAEQHGIMLTPLTRTATPLTLKGES